MRTCRTSKREWYHVSFNEPYNTNMTYSHVKVNTLEIENNWKLTWCEYCFVLLWFWLWEEGASWSQQCHSPPPPHPFQSTGEIEGCSEKSKYLKQSSQEVLSELVWFISCNVRFQFKVMSNSFRKKFWIKLLGPNWIQTLFIRKNVASHD